MTPSVCSSLFPNEIKYYCDCTLCSHCRISFLLLDLGGVTNRLVCRSANEHWQLWWRSRRHTDTNHQSTHPYPSRLRDLPSIISFYREAKNIQTHENPRIQRFGLVGYCFCWCTFVSNVIELEKLQELWEIA